MLTGFEEATFFAGFVPLRELLLAGRVRRCAGLFDLRELLAGAGLFDLRGLLAGAASYRVGALRRLRVMFVARYIIQTRDGYLVYFTS